MDTSKVTRFEVIDHTRTIEQGGGRTIVLRNQHVKFELSLQDDGRTLKVFIVPREEVVWPHDETM